MTNYIIVPRDSMEFISLAKVATAAVVRKLGDHTKECVYDEEVEGCSAASLFSFIFEGR